MTDVAALGELLIDFTTSGTGKMGNPAFEMNPGGAPINCLAALCRLGGSGAYIGMVGRDFFGDFILDKLSAVGMETGGVGRAEGIPTTLAFVALAANGERSFSFVRKPGADILLKKEDVDLSIIDDAKIFHFGSLSLTDEPARSATIHAVEYAKSRGKLISYDPNYRAMLWPDVKTAMRYMSLGLEYADIVKMSEEEMELITGVDQSRPMEGAKKILKTGKQAVFITMGAAGAYYAMPQGSGFAEGYKVDAVDTTGCGDAFTGAVLYMLCHKPDAAPEELVRFGNASGALCATKFGGMPAMATLPELLALMGR